MTHGLLRVSKKGFKLMGNGPQVLLLHGYTGTPYDLKPLAVHLNCNGALVSAPLLKGHGTKPSDLLNVSAEDWIIDALSAVSELDDDRPIFLGGLSMGALLAILLASEDRRADGLLLFAPALRLSVISEIAVTTAALGFLPKTASLKKLSGGSDVLDREAKKKSPAYKEMPVSGLLEFDRVRRLAYDKIEKVSCPLFVAFGKKDGAIDVAASHDIITDRCKQPVLTKYYENSKHIVTLDCDRAKVFADTCNFIAKHS